MIIRRDNKPRDIDPQHEGCMNQEVTTANETGGNGHARTIHRNHGTSNNDGQGLISTMVPTTQTWSDYSVLNDF